MLGEFFALAYPYHQKSIELKWNEILYVNPNSLYMLMLIDFRVRSKQFLLTMKDNVKNKEKASWNKNLITFQQDVLLKSTKLFGWFMHDKIMKKVNKKVFRNDTSKMTQSPYPSVLDFWKIKFEKSS